jgi:hypothetical protein
MSVDDWELLFVDWRHEYFGQSGGRAVGEILVWLLKAATPHRHPLWFVWILKSLSTHGVQGTAALRQAGLVQLYPGPVDTTARTL